MANQKDGLDITAHARVAADIVMMNLICGCLFRRYIKQEIIFIQKVNFYKKNE